MWTEYDDSFPAFHAAYLADKARWGGHHGVLAKEGQLPPQLEAEEQEEQLEEQLSDIYFTSN